MHESSKIFLSLKSSVYDLYHSLGSVYCPYFCERVRFTSDGFHHLLYKGFFKQRSRQRSQQFLRLKLFRLAPKLLRLTFTLQEYHQEQQFFSVVYNQCTEKVLKIVQYWGFIAIIDHVKIKVVVKQIGNGPKKFWSIIPNWVTRKSREKFLHIYHIGNLEQD